MMKKRLALPTIMIALTLSACGNSEINESSSSTNTPVEHSSEVTDHGDMHTMEHSNSAEIPEGLTEASDPEFPVGSQAIMEVDHMPGMKGAEATIVGAYDTTVYAVSYTPMTGGEPVRNHKWVIQEDLENPESEPHQPGDTVVLNTDHMSGMKGASATIDSAEQTTVYMVDYTPTTGGDPVRNHRWLTAEELSSAAQ
ncbi:YdhK family protein [Saccharibacillus kuerlensis]|uniref:DUF1541 domain-containing protein n=1 Tax=Saccharibacillus kuerlensis TaxID=459527 RepID=A0ABQ2L411_9BACL|nr:YdhK family protein [Saccharibacillus kuerlensis]GGO01258.1 hypothetical protein GCM10010969_23380 [Saccharibacillus kuerlensis]